MFCEKLAASFVTRSISCTLSTPNLQALEASYLQRKQLHPPTEDVAPPSPRMHRDVVICKPKLSTLSGSGYNSWSEAPARLGTSPKDGILYHRPRSSSVPDNAFCKLDPFSPMTRVVTGTDLPYLIDCADLGIRSGVKPFLAEGAMGGTYFFRDMRRKVCVVFKPSDEEPMAPNNPYQQSHKYGAAYKGHITPGFGMFRELATYIIDRGFAGVPPTAIAKARLEAFNTGGDISDLKIGSVQSYVRHECSAEEMGPSKFDRRSVQTVAILDMRLCNQDRHPGNLLVCDSNPYRLQQLRPIGVDIAEVSQQSQTDLQQRGSDAAADASASTSPVVVGRESESSRTDPFPFHFETVECVSELLRESSDDLPSPAADASDCDDESAVTVLAATSADSNEPVIVGRKRSPSTQTPAGSPVNPRSFTRHLEDRMALSISPSAAGASRASSPSLESIGSRTTAESFLQSESGLEPGKYSLAPIDHGYCLPHILYTGEAVFAWLDWPQAKEPLPADLITYVHSLDADAEADAIMKCIGASLPPTALLTLKVCTYLLQRGVAAGWTLEKIGRMMVRPSFDSSSKLELLIARCMAKLRAEHGTSDARRALSPRHVCIAEDERLLCDHAEEFLGYVQLSINEMVLSETA